MNEHNKETIMCTKTHMMQDKVVNGTPMIVCKICGYNYPTYTSIADRGHYNSKITL
jgi:hypothetical protein